MCLVDRAAGDKIIGVVNPCSTLPKVARCQRADGITDAGIITLELSQFVPITINFDAGSGSPSTYTESGLTVTTLHPSGSRHLHLGFNDGLLNHAGCCSSPYLFDMGGQPFTVVRLDVITSAGFGSSGTHAFTRSSGAVETILPVPGTTHEFPSSGWQNITEFTWGATGFMSIDNLVIEVPQ